MQIRIDLPHDIRLVEPIKAANGALLGLVLEPTFYRKDAKAPVMFLTVSLSEGGEPHQQVVISVSGTTGNIIREVRQASVKPAVEAGGDAKTDPHDEDEEEAE